MMRQTTQSSSNQTNAKFSSINSRKQESFATSFQEQHSIVPFNDEEQNDLSHLFGTKTYSKNQEEGAFRAKVKRNSESQYMDLLNKENQFHFANMEMEEGSKTTREEANSLINPLQATGGFSKAAKRMKPDTLQPILATIDPQVNEKKHCKQKIKIIPKLR